MAKREPASAPVILGDDILAAITSIQVRGYKSLADAQLRVRPLTLLAGTNSSGKSSIMQPLLLIKQTLQASYQTAGALLLDGPHVQITSAEQILSKVAEPVKLAFSLRLEGHSYWRKDEYLALTYSVADAGFRLANQDASYWEDSVHLRPEMTEEELLLENPSLQRFKSVGSSTVSLTQHYHFLDAVGYNEAGQPVSSPALALGFSLTLLTLLHIPGLRTAPKRSYPAAAYQRGNIRGTFDAYTAGLILHWQQQKDTTSLAALTDALQRLGLTGAVEASTLNANELEVKVGRLPVGAKIRKKDLVNIADVGFGVSQVLPIVVALIAAEPGQLVYIEQPELHLHPRAQVQMAHLLAAAAKRGVRVIAETHSSLILLTVQTLVAEGTIAPEEVALHWFERDAKGATQITLAEVDENGAYGPWPEDFGDVELTAQSAYLDAVARRHAKPKPKA